MRISDWSSDVCSSDLIGSLSPGAKLAFPDDNDFPPLRLEQFTGPTIAGYVSIELLDPESRVAFRRGGNLAAGMTMPEAPVDEPHRPVEREDHDRVPREVIGMNAETEGGKRGGEGKRGS